MDSLVPLYKSMSETETGNFLGLSILNHTKEIGHLIKEVDAKTVLDYGCGRGEAYRSPHKVHHKWGLRRSQVTLYDPAFHHAPVRGFHRLRDWSGVPDPVQTRRCGVGKSVSRLFLHRMPAYGGRPGIIARPGHLASGHKIKLGAGESSRLLQIGRRLEAAEGYELFVLVPL